MVCAALDVVFKTDNMLLFTALEAFVGDINDYKFSFTIYSYLWNTPLDKIIVPTNSAWSVFTYMLTMVDPDYARTINIKKPLLTWLAKEKPELLSTVLTKHHAWLYIDVIMLSIDPNQLQLTKQVLRAATLPMLANYRMNSMYSDDVLHPLQAQQARARLNLEIRQRRALAWTSKRHVAFEGIGCHTTILCVLLSANHFNPTLHDELWHLIFSCFTQGDFSDVKPYVQEGV